MGLNLIQYNFLIGGLVLYSTNVGSGLPVDVVHAKSHVDHISQHPTMYGKLTTGPQSEKKNQDGNVQPDSTL